MRTLKQLFLLALIFFCLFLVWLKFLREIPPEDVVLREVFGADSIELEHISQNEFQGIYSLDRARCTGFKKVSYRGYDHYYMGSGATLSIPNSGDKPRYKIIEKMSANDSERWTRKVKLEIIDTSEDEVMAVREIWLTDGGSAIGFEGLGGYKGDIAAKFARKVLSPPQIQWSSTCTTAYPGTEVEVDISEFDFVIDEEELFSKTTNCSDISIMTFQNLLDIRVSSPHWAYKTRNHPDHVYCTDDEVFVFHRIFWDELYIDWIDSSGILKGQYVVRYSDPLVTSDLKYEHIDEVRFLENTLEITQIQISPSMKNGASYSGKAVKSVFSIDIENSQGRNDWCDGVGEQYSYSSKSKECNEVSPPNPMESLNKPKHSDGLKAAGV